MKQRPLVSRSSLGQSINRNVAKAAEDTFLDGFGGLHGGFVAKLFDELLVGIGQILGNVDHDVDQLVAGCIAIVGGETLAAQTENLAWLRAGAIFSRARPVMVGTSTEPPKAAVAKSSIRL